MRSACVPRGIRFRLLSILSKIRRGEMGIAVA
jgi:hypothetical protein